MRFPLVIRLLLTLVAAMVLASCGGGKKSTTPATPASITVSTTSFSLNHGDVTQIGGIQVFDANKNAITPIPTVTFTSSSTSIATVSSGGLICGGIFDANNIVCQTKDSNGNPLPSGTATVTVTAGGVNTTITVFVHDHLDKITVSTANPPVCVSQNGTQQFTATAFSGTRDITSTVGPFTWSTANAAIGSVDSNGLATSKLPGATMVVASVGAVTGSPALFIACAPKTISLHLANATDTSFTVAAGTSQTVAADVTDILGQSITGAPLTFGNFVPTAAQAGPSGSVSAPGAGRSSIVASCTPAACNPALPANVNANGSGVGLAVYSNPVIANVTGTTATTVYVTGADNPDGSANKTLLPIDSTSNAAATGITLPNSPNSMVFNRAGTTAYLGSSGGLMIFDAASNTVTSTVTAVTGTVLAISPDGIKVIVSDTGAGKVFVYDTAAKTTETFSLSGVTSVDYAGDNSKAYLAGGSSVAVYAPNTTLRTVSLSATGVAFTPQESVAYFGGSSITALATCNNAQVDSAAGAVNVLAPTVDGTHMIAAGNSGWVDLTYSVSNVGCPSTASNTARVAALPAFVSSPIQITVAPDDSNAFLTGYAGTTPATGVPFYRLAVGASGTVPLTGPGGQLFSGGVTQDRHSLYVGVGGTPPQVHRIDLTAAAGPADAQQINVSFNPRIVVVRPK